MDFLAANFEERIAVEERESVVDVLQLKVQAGQFDLGYPLLADDLVRSGNDWTRLVSFVDLNVVRILGAAIIFDFLISA
jgi:hypothetical protein